MVLYAYSNCFLIRCMAFTDKTSVREEFSKLKSEFEQLKSHGMVPKECRILMQSIFILVELILVIFLEKKTKKNQNNSSIPPSQSDKDNTSFNGKLTTNGKGKVENNLLADNTKTTETVTNAQVSVCEICGEDLSDTPCCGTERRTKIDIIFEKTIKHVDAEIKLCPSCKKISKGSFPVDMHGPLQYGNGLKAYIINLVICQMVALNRVQKMVKSMIAVTLSEATLLKYILRLYEVLADWEVNAIEKLLLMPAINVDETSLRVDKKKQWIHVYSGREITVKLLHPKRGRKAIEDFNIIPRYSGAIIHDCWPAYLSYNNCEHGLCGSHLLRELAFVIESNGYAWAKNMKRLLKDACEIVANRKNKKMSKKQYANLQKRYRNIITRGQNELPIIPPKRNGKKGKIAKSDAHNLWERLKKYEAAVLLFARDSNVSFTNNRAEQDLRMAKVKQKVSGCFRIPLLAKAYCRISSYLQTMANKGYNPLIAIQMALNEKIEL